MPSPSMRGGKIECFLQRLNDHKGLFLILFVAMLYPKLCDITSEACPTPKHFIAVAILDFVEAYLLVGILSFVGNNRVFKFCSGAVLFITFFEGLLRMSAIAFAHGALDEDILAAVLTTNAEEASEMVGTFFSLKNVCLFLGYPCIIAVTIYLTKKIRNWYPSEFCSKTFFVIFLLGGVFVGYCWYAKNGIAGQATPNQTKNLIICYNKVIHSNDHHIIKTNPRLTVNKDGQPPLIVWIVGESTSSHHSSLYGYAKPTNPLLQKRVDAGQAYAYKKVKSAWTHTQESIKLMMSTYSKRSGTSAKWYECTTLPEVAHLAGYHTYWISNQSKKGLYDNYAGQYSEFCDTSVFIGNKFAGCSRFTYDGDLIPVMRQLLQKPTPKDFFIVHLMGCHNSFDRRYPASFEFFKEDDYSDRPSSQRHNLATYDNAARYNDFVVSTIMNLVSKREAIVVYAPDHGLDIYQTRPDHCAHGIRGNKKSENISRDIPFIIYMSSLYRQRHPDVATGVAKSVNKNFDTENIIYLMMDLMQCDFNPSVVKRLSIIR